jgi:hypothetical protein
MNRLRVIGLLSFLVIGWSHEAVAAPILWTLSGVTFGDGSTASGSFVYDRDFESLTNFDVITTPTSQDCGPGFPPDCVVITPNDLPGHHYVDLTGFFPPYPANGFGIADPPSGGSFAGKPLLGLGFASPLSNAGGSITLLTISGEGFCFDAGCNFASYKRFVTAGSVVGTPASAPVPEPATFALLGTGLAAVIGRRRQGRLG